MDKEAWYNFSIMKEISSVLWIEQKLREQFLQEANVTNHEKGYVSVPSVNQRIDIEMQGWAADMIVNHYLQTGSTFNAVVGIPNSGISLATSIAERLRLPLAPGRKGKDGPGAWNMQIKVTESVPSFTTGEASQFVFNGIQKGDKVLAIEDVIARGDTLGLIVEAFRKQGIELCVGAYFSKLFQGGVVKLETMGVEVFSVIEIEKLYPNPDKPGEWSLQLTPPHFPDSGF